MVEHCSGLHGGVHGVWCRGVLRSDVLLVQPRDDPPRGQKSREFSGVQQVNSGTSPLASALAGDAPEVSISRDLVKRGLWITPAVLIVGTVAAGGAGAASAGAALVLVLLNFSMAAGLIAVTAPISLGLMMGAILFGYILRLALITAAVLLVKDQSWVHLPVLGITIIVTHLGLLFWEMKYVAASLAFPGLRPNAQDSSSSTAAEKH